MTMEFDKEQENQVQPTFKALEEEDPKKEESAEVPAEDKPEDKPEEETVMTDLLGEPMEADSVAKSKPAPKPKKKAASTANAKKPIKPDKKYSTEYLIAYAGNNENVPVDEMTLEQIREYLEPSFPELSKERAELLVDEDKKIIAPRVKGAKKG